uniref:Putative endo-1,3;1,4-beta-glucanase n=1 Tax=Alexandrium fundyense TaxID=2932 RepID=A4UHA6_ALEFU|nr:putative endo-1,3;1,4-beta-glucanase [Alexandrium fundyense]
MMLCLFGRAGKGLAHHAPFAKACLPVTSVWSRAASCGGVCPEGALPASFGGVDYGVKGREIDLGGANVYVTGDPSWKSSVIVMHDVFGANGGSHKALCDGLAAGGHYVVMPDFFEGGSIEPYYKAKQVPEGKRWLKKFNWAHCSQILDYVHAHLRERGVERTGSIGFCWGAWAVAKACQDPTKVQAGVWCHPSCQVGKEPYEGETEQELTDAVRSPTLILPSPQEPDFYRNGELAKIMGRKRGHERHTVLFSRIRHMGWVVRAAGFLDALGRIAAE